MCIPAVLYRGRQFINRAYVPNLTMCVRFRPNQVSVNFLSWVRVDGRSFKRPFVYRVACQIHNGNLITLSEQEWMIYPQFLFKKSLFSIMVSLLQTNNKFSWELISIQARKHKRHCCKPGTALLKNGKSFEKKQQQSLLVFIPRSFTEVGGGRYDRWIVGFDRQRLLKNGAGTWSKSIK